MLLTIKTILIKMNINKHKQAIMKRSENMKSEEYITSKAYRLTEPGTFEEENIHHSISDNQVVVETSMVSICHADIRYYSGQRRKEALQKKLPMALFHEGIGHVTKSNCNEFQKGDRVVIVPNIPARRLNEDAKDKQDKVQNEYVTDNYLADSVFLGSGFDGIGQQYLVLSKENVVPIPNVVPDEIAVLAELTSVSLQATKNVSDFLSSGYGDVAVFGDGPVGYLTASVLHHIYSISKENLIVFGASNERLKHFDFPKTYNIQDVDFHEQENVKTVIECTGGNFSKDAINQAIELIDPRGKVVLMGVSEEYVPINTRDILEKGLAIYGSSRSTEEEFKTLMQAFQKKEFQHTLRKLIPEEHNTIENAKDLEKEMERSINNKEWKKTLLYLKWG